MKGITLEARNTISMILRRSKYYFKNTVENSGLVKEKSRGGNRGKTFFSEDLFHFSKSKIENLGDH